LDTPAVLFERRHVAPRIREPAIFAGRGQAEHPVSKFAGGHARTQPRLELLPRALGSERLAVARCELQVWRERRTRHLQAHAADPDRAANLQVRAIVVLLPGERTRAAVAGA